MLRKRGMAFVVLFLFVILQSNHIFAEDVMAGTVGRLSLTVLNAFDGEAGDSFPKDDDYSKEYTDREQPRSGMGDIGDCPNTVGCVVGVHIPDPGGDEIEKHMAHVNT